MLSFNTSGTLPGITQVILNGIFTVGGDLAATELTEPLPTEMKEQVIELLQRIRDNSTIVLTNLGRLIVLFACLSCAASINAQRAVRPELIPLPPPMQFIDRILRPCGSGATPFVSAIAASDGDFDIVTCVGRSVTVNGTPITPGAGLGDPGSNGYVVRTALNTTAARTFSVSTPITITNANGVAGNTALACPTCVTSAASLTSTALMTGAGLQAAQTPAATATLAVNGNISTPGTITTGNAGGVNGAIDLFGSVSGTFTQTVANAAGTWQFTWPVDDGTAGQFLQTDGAGIASWQTVGAGFTCAACSLDTLQKGDGAGNLADSSITDDGTSIITSATVFRPSVGGGTNLGSAIRPFGSGFIGNITISGEATVISAIRTSSAANTDLAGLLTVGGGGTVAYTFTQTYVSAPVCVSSDTDAAPNITGASANTTTLTVTGTAGHVVSYICIGRN